MYVPDTPFRLNCDIGERGPDHPTDLELMRWIDIANIACGGHAGDRTSVEVFRTLALERGVTPAAHLSYPDRAGFGRSSMDISIDRLLTSLEEQYALLPEATTIKFHGALYHDSCRRPDLATALAGWLVKAGITTVITMPDSSLAGACAGTGLTIVPEAFAERRYHLDEDTGALTLLNRARPGASIDTVEEALAQATCVFRAGTVTAIVDLDEGTSVEREAPLHAETICVHSDSAIALDLVRKLSEFQRRERAAQQAQQELQAQQAQPPHTVKE